MQECIQKNQENKHKNHTLIKKARKIMLLINLLISLALIVQYFLYNYRTRAYHQSPPGISFAVFNLIFHLYFSLQFLLSVILAQNILDYIFSQSGMVQIITFGTYFISRALYDGFFLQEDYSKSGLIHLANIGSILRLVLFTKLSQFYSFQSQIYKQLFEIIIQIFTFVIFSSAFIQLMVYYDFYNGKSIDQQSIQDLEYYLYFVMTTLSTEGYQNDLRDYNLLTLRVQLTLIVLILLSLYILQQKSFTFISHLSPNSYYKRISYKKVQNIPHIVLLGSTNSIALQVFFHQFYHQDHGTDPKHIVILSPHRPSIEIQNFLSMYQNNIIYIQGDPLDVVFNNQNESLKKCQLQTAISVIILSKKTSQEIYQEDTRTILQAMVLKKYLHSHQTKGIKFCMQLLGREGKMHYYLSMSKQTFHDRVICLSELKMSLFARSCLCPGLIAFLSNLIITSSKQKQKREDEWLKQYWKGQQYQIYKFQLPQIMMNKKFSEIAVLIYKVYRCTLFAIEVINKHTKQAKRLAMNPNWVFLQCQQNEALIGYIIAEDKQKADLISGYVGQQHLVKRSYIFKQESKSQINRQECQSDFQRTTNKQKFSHLNYADINILNNCHKTKQRVIFKDIYYKTLKNNIVANKHIILSGSSENLTNFIAPLRSLKQKNYPPIVILNQEEPNDKQWNQLSYFPLIYFVKGTALKQSDLKRANISDASRVQKRKEKSRQVLIEQAEQKSQLSKDEIDLLDAKTIFKFKTVRKLRPDIPIFTELISSQNIIFLIQNDQNYKLMNQHGFTSVSGCYQIPVFAAGYVYISSIMDRLICQSLYNSALLNVFNSFLLGNMFQSTEDDNSKIAQIDIPIAFQGKTYEYMFEYLMTKKQILCLALYRKEQTQNHLYIWTNPQPATILRNTDKIILLTQNINEQQCYLISLDAFYGGPHEKRTHSVKIFAKKEEPVYKNRMTIRQQKQKDIKDLLIVQKIEQINKRIDQLKKLTVEINKKVQMRQKQIQGQTKRIIMQILQQNFKEKSNDLLM